MGVGKIGGEVAYLSSVMGIADEIQIYDCNPSLLQAQKLDLIHTGINVKISADNNDIRDSDIILFSAGLPRNPAIKRRADLLESNLVVAEQFCEKIKGFKGVVICVTNPMDAISYYVSQNADIDRKKCIGFGGQLDLARFECFLKLRGINPKNSFVIGEHGEYQVPVFSEIADEVIPKVREEILLEMRGASMPIISGKGGTVFGPAYNIINLIRAVSENKKEILPCSCTLEGEYELSELSIGVPAIIGKNGIERIIERDLDSWEEKKFKEAAEHLKDLCSKV